MLCLKLSRVGKKGQASFRLIVTGKTKDPWGEYLELLGHYNPKTKKADLKIERIKHWIKQGAQTTATVHNLLLKEKVIEGQKRKTIKISKKRLEKNKSSSAKAPEIVKAPEVKEEIKVEK